MMGNGTVFLSSQTHLLSFSFIPILTTVCDCCVMHNELCMWFVYVGICDNGAAFWLCCVDLMCSVVIYYCLKLLLFAFSGSVFLCSMFPHNICCYSGNVVINSYELLTEVLLAMCKCSVLIFDGMLHLIMSLVVGHYKVFLSVNQLVRVKIAIYLEKTELHVFTIKE